MIWDLEYWAARFLTSCGWQVSKGPPLSDLVIKVLNSSTNKFKENISKNNALLKRLEEKSVDTHQGHA